jgi:DNA-binding response OmpR family regulator
MSSNERQPTIFLVEEDDDARPILKSNLKRDGYGVLLALDEDDALDRVSGGRLSADLILVNLVGKAPEESLLIGRRIRQYGEFKSHTPLIIMAEKYGQDLEGTDVNVSDNDWITYLENHEQLQRLLRSLTAKRSGHEPE